jgi:hypothetical protein
VYLLPSCDVFLPLSCSQGLWESYPPSAFRANAADVAREVIAAPLAMAAWRAAVAVPQEGGGDGGKKEH